MPVRYFQGVDDDYYYQVSADNGEVLVTSEGYRDETDAKRGFEALKRAIAETVFSIEWPGGVQHVTMPHALVAEEGSIPGPSAEPVSRLESGPVRFGDDWTGLWLRGDSCFAYALALKAERSQSADAFSRAGVDGLIQALESTNERGGGSAGP